LSPADGGGTPLAYPFATPPEPGALTEIVPSLFWLRMPLPFQLNHINLWLVEEVAGWTLIDTGLDVPEARRIWDEILATKLGGKRLTRILVTHFHPDHIGLAGWLSERTGAPLWISETEWLWARMLRVDSADAPFIEEQLAFYRRAGADEATIRAFSTHGNAYAPHVSPVPRAYHRLEEGMELAIGGRRWQVVIGRGHAPEHACLYCPELAILIAGDQVLPKISPNIGVWPSEPAANPLARYLETLAALPSRVPDGVLVLPSHNLPFRGLWARIEQLQLHHAERLAAVEAACAQPQTALEIVPALFRRELPSHQLGFAIGETLAHVNYLLAEQRLVASERGDGLKLYRRA
jgi:glyoxylase-like metal-dependent hydrolase (beta-lactamase superfamily II)